MAKDLTSKDALTVGVYKMLVFVLALFYAAGLVGIIFSILHDLPKRVRGAEWSFFGQIANSIGTWLTAFIYLLVLYQLYRLLLKVVKGDPFNPDNPRRIRRVAYGAFAIAAANMIHEVVWILGPFTNMSLWEVLFWAVYRTAQMALFGLGILIIAKVLETGVRLQQEQNLTI